MRRSKSLYFNDLELNGISKEYPKMGFQDAHIF